MINIDFLSYLLEYSKTESLTKASKSLHISQSALTRAMQKVEDYIGVPIFDRTKNKLTLNLVGKELVKNAALVLEAERTMKERTLAFYNSATNISVGVTAPGPMIKYGNLLFSIFPNKQIVSKVEEDEGLIENLLASHYDFVFTCKPYDDEKITSQFAYTEHLYVTLPKTHFLSGMKTGVHFSEIDGQSFLVSQNLGVWDAITAKHLPNSKFFPQSMDNLHEIINSSTLPHFSTNITIPTRNETDRVNLPILDDDAKVRFYLTYKKQDKNKLRKLLKLVGN